MLAILPLIYSCSRNVEESKTTGYKTELDKIISETPTTTAIVSDDGLFGLPSEYIYNPIDGYHFIFTSKLIDRAYYFSAKEIEVVKTENGFCWAKNISPNESVLIYPVKNLKKFNSIDHNTLCEKFTKYRSK